MACWCPPSAWTGRGRRGTAASRSRRESSPAGPRAAGRPSPASSRSESTGRSVRFRLPGAGGSRPSRRSRRPTPDVRRSRTLRRADPRSVPTKRPVPSTQRVHGMTRLPFTRWPWNNTGTSAKGCGPIAALIASRGVPGAVAGTPRRPGSAGRKDGGEEVEGRITVPRGRFERLVRASTGSPAPGAPSNAARREEPSLVLAPLPTARRRRLLLAQLRDRGQPPVGTGPVLGPRLGRTISPSFQLALGVQVAGLGLVQLTGRQVTPRPGCPRH